MRYRLRTLLIVLALGPVAIWGGVRLYLRATFPPQIVHPIIPVEIVEFDDESRP